MDLAYPNNTSPPSDKSGPRILACVLCQTRKVKCDRNSPCGNCVKANVTCIPSTPAPPRKRRRPNRDLQQRLARCEDLLAKYAGGKVPPAAAPAAAGASSNSGAEKPQADPTPWKPMGRLIVSDDTGTPKFTDDFIWATVQDQLREMRQIVDGEGKDEERTPDTNDGSFSDDDTTLVLDRTPFSSFEDYLPSPGQAILLWQVFLDRVNPLTKIIHFPTVQPMLIEATTNPGNVSKNNEVLLLSIYLLGTVSMTPEECSNRLGMSRKAAISRFSEGARRGLTTIGILKTDDLTIVQAILLYTASLCHRQDFQAAWAMMGTVVRIAMKMGIHRDGETLGLSPFESEMRRRVWWQIFIMDHMCAMKSGVGRSSRQPIREIKDPANLNDSDLYPSMTSIQSKDGPTDMIFVLVNVRFTRLFMEGPGFDTMMSRLKTVSGADMSAEFDTMRKGFDRFSKELQGILSRCCNPAFGPVHDFTLRLTESFLKNMRELCNPPDQQREFGTEIFDVKDFLFKMSIMMVERQGSLYASCAPNHLFMWYATTSFSVEVILFVVGQLSKRLEGSLVDRVWAGLERLYEHNHSLYDFSLKLRPTLASHVLRAWKMRSAKVFETTGSFPVIPVFVLRLREMIPKDDSKTQTPDSAVSDPVKMEQTLMQDPIGSLHASGTWDPNPMIDLFTADNIDWGNGGFPVQINYGDLASINMQWGNQGPFL